MEVLTIGKNGQWVEVLFISYPLFFIGLYRVNTHQLYRTRKREIAHPDLAVCLLLCLWISVLINAYHLEEIKKWLS